MISVQADWGRQASSTERKQALPDPKPTRPKMKTTESLEEVEIESGPARVARLAFLGSVLFWPLFLFAVKFMLDPPLKNTAAEVERTALVYCTWLYPLAVGLGWLLSKSAMRRGSPEAVCLLPWLIPGLVACYWLVYFLL
jgi:hypothetical protein